MTKSEKLISEFFKPYFDKYPEMDSFWFTINLFDANEIFLGEEDFGINGQRWDQIAIQLRKIIIPDVARPISWVVLGKRG